MFFRKSSSIFQRASLSTEFATPADTKDEEDKGEDSDGSSGVRKRLGVPAGWWGCPSEVPRRM